MSMIKLPKNSIKFFKSNQDKIFRSGKLAEGPWNEKLSEKIKNITTVITDYIYVCIYIYDLPFTIYSILINNSIQVLYVVRNPHYNYSAKQKERTNNHEARITTGMKVNGSQKSMH